MQIESLIYRKKFYQNLAGWIFFFRHLQLVPSFSLIPVPTHFLHTSKLPNFLIQWLQGFQYPSDFSYPKPQHIEQSLSDLIIGKLGGGISPRTSFFCGVIIVFYSSIVSLIG